METGLSNDDLRIIEEKERDSTIKFRATSTIRVTSGGAMNDFDELQQATNFMFRQLREFCYASIHIKCPIIFKEEEWSQITEVT